MSIIEREVQVPEVQGPITEREHRARVLEAAALEVEVRGWCRKFAVTPEGSVCMVGAVHFAVGGTERCANDGYATLADVWGLKQPHEPLLVSAALKLPLWNDKDGRTAKEVTDLFRWRAEEIRDGR